MDQGRLSGTGLPRDDGDPFPFLALTPATMEASAPK